MVLKIKADILLGFLRKTTANGLVEDCKLKFTKEGLDMQHINLQRNVMIQGVLPKDIFDSYENTEINIKNTETLLKVLATFIVSSDNMVKIMDRNGGIDLSLAEKVECYNAEAIAKVSDIEYDNSAVIQKSTFDVIKKRNDIIKSEQIVVELKDKKMILAIGDKIDKANVIQDVTVDANCRVVFEYDLFDKLSKQFDVMVDVSLTAEAAPSRFAENGDDYSITYYLMSSEED